MGSALSANIQRPYGPTFRLAFEHRPHCDLCGAEMVIRHSSKPRTIIDLEHNIQIITNYYRCNTDGCEGMKSRYLRPENPYAPPKADFSFEVYAKICAYRWKKLRTYHEIMDDMQTDYNIHLTQSTVECALKIYEIGCAEKYRDKYIEMIRKNGGIIITIDGMAPIQGNKSLYVVYDYLTGLTIGSWRIPNQKNGTIELFLNRIKQKVNKEIGCPILGIISDALPSQRIAIENAFPDIPHCLCHYHFYELVLKEPKQVDSHIMTQIRKELRGLYDLEKYKERKSNNIIPLVACEFLKMIYDMLEALSNWKRHPKDPCFSGLVLYSRVKDIYDLLEQACSKIDAGLIFCADEKPVRRMHKKLSEIIEEHKENAKELAKIQDHLAIISSILSNLDLSFNNGLKKLRAYRDKLRKYRFSPHCGKIECSFIEALMKYIRTKGEMLFNFKKVNGAPTTNNKHELKYKQLKHFLRRVIGFASAKRYLLSHGERIVYVQMDDEFTDILEILRATDFIKARKIISKERTSRMSLPYTIHYAKEWGTNLEKAKKLLLLLETPLIIIN